MWKEGEWMDIISQLLHQNMVPNPPVNALSILAHLSISFGKSPVTGQNASVPNFFSAISFTLPPTLSLMITPLSMAFLPCAFILSFHVFFSGVAEPELDIGAARRGGG